MNDQTLARLREIIVKQMGVEPGEVHDGATWDSLQMNHQTTASFLEKVNEAFKCEIGLKEMKSFETIGHVVKWLEAR